MKRILDSISHALVLAGRTGFIHLLSANLLIQIAGFGGQIFLTRILSVEDIGAIKILQSYLNIFVVLASLGLNTAVLKLASEDIERKEQINIFNICLILTIFSSLILIIIVYLLMDSSLLNIDPIFEKYILILPLLSLINLIIVYLQSQQKIKLISNVQSFSKIFIVIISVLIAYLYDFEAYIFSLIVLNFITFIIIIPFIKHELITIIRVKFSKGILIKIKNIGIFALGANLLSVLLANVNIIMASSLIDNISEIAFYSIAQLIIITMMMIPSTLGQVMVPKISKVSKNLGEVFIMYKKYRIKNTILAISVAILAGILAPFIIPFVFGEEYRNSVIYFEILLIGFVCWSVYSPKSITLVGIGKSNYNFYVSLISFVFNVILNYFLIKSLGVIGAALANSITYFITIFINIFFFEKIFKKGELN